jgi:hypothetical protein
VTALVLSKETADCRITLSTKKLEKEPGDYLRPSREDFLKQAEEQAAALRAKVARAAVNGPFFL